MLKKILALALVPAALVLPDMARAGGATILAVDSTTTSITTLDDATINFTYGCDRWVSGGTVQLYIEGTTPIDIGSPVTVPDITTTSYQFSGSITHRFTVAGTYVVNARVVGTIDSVSASYCDVSEVRSGPPLTITVSAPSTTTLASETPQTGSNTSLILSIAVILIASGGLLTRRRRIN